MARPAAGLCLLLAALAGLASGQLAEQRFEDQLLAQKRVVCSTYDLSIVGLNLACSYGNGPFCKARATGRLAPELANITTLTELALNGQTWPGRCRHPGAHPEPSESSKPCLSAEAGPPEQHVGCSLPSEWGTAGAFPKLTALYLDENGKLTGPLPAAWSNAGAWRSLEILSITSTNLKGSLPVEWANPGAFPKLADLVLYFNFLSGTLPAAWGSNSSLPALRTLELSVNAFMGTLPPQWGTSGGFKTLTQLSLDSNLLNGALPAAWAQPGAFPRLKGLALNNNTELCGAVPLALFPAVCEAPPPSGTDCFGSALPACTAKFAAGPAADVASLLALRRSVSNWDAYSKGNKIAGWNESMPVCKWTGVTCSQEGAILAVDLGCPYTQADLLESGTLPAEVASISSLQILSLYNQNVTGTLPVAWGAKGAFANLTELDLTHNQISGTLPEGWADEGAFPVLSTLRLERNKLNGTLPASWATNSEAHTPFMTLRSLYLRSNALTGPVPPKWSSTFRLLGYLDLGNNSLSGTLPDRWGQNNSFPKLTELYLNNQRNLTGPLPAAWGSNGSFPALWRLDVNNNKLTAGPLPESWGSPNMSFRSVGSLRCCREMNNNQFTGTLPAAWGSNGTFQGLGTLELRNNRLSGSIPDLPKAERYTALPSLCSALAGNEGLCGAIPTRLSQATCDDPTATVCTRDLSQINCGLATPGPAPAPSPPGPSPAEPPPPTTSSVPIGAIVGGIAARLPAVAAVLAFFALRPRKGWLLRQTPVFDIKQPDSERSSQAYPRRPNKLDVDDDGDDDGPLSKLAPTVDPQLFSVVPHTPADVNGGKETSSLPYSYITTGGMHGVGDRRAPSCSSTPPSFHTPRTQSLTAGGGTLENDPVLTFISTRLATLQGTQGSATSSALRSRSSYSSLPEEVRQWAVRWDAIQLEQMIGEGSFGRVYLAVWNTTPVAVKVLINADGSEPNQDLELPPEIMKQLQEEAVVMSRMRHPNIVSFMGICTLPACILTEYCSRGSLYDVVRLAGRVPQLAEELTWSLRLSMAFDATSPNLLVDEHLRVKVCDFNLSEIMRHQGGNESESEGATNPIWLAPEVLEGHRATQASDVYSYGLVLWELLTWQLHWRRKHPYQVRRSVLDGKRPHIPAPEDLPGSDSATPEGLDAYLERMRDCWHQDARQRPSFVDIVTRLQGLIGDHDPPRIDSHDSR
ncbi:Serine threonine-kinase CTR1 isoform A [Micractinium conductrix]|uniref:Serine threonine-kinase CTR1 isoform A n=1 Tax=Micractinium conductrix TaxID=554055 RepID=A0A2P6V6I0_9CHLO|nr:Serine threonine-kinase CTR1 isoform A [Micractinium conductrix]|eukprot:PSC69697.1 Serine threonine-kinase CTR1 isoform A [Micractinium conductrix]